MSSAAEANIFVWLQWIQYALLLGGLVAFILLETLAPDIRASFGVRTRSAARNLTIFVVSAVVTGVVIGTFYFYGAWFLERNRVGLLNLIALPVWIVVLIGFLMIDFTDYLFHRLSHEKKWLWVMHAVHHSDPRLDVTTHFRAHPAHMLVSIGWRLVAIAALGVPLWVVMLRDAVQGPIGQWQHSNVRVPRWLDRLLCPVIVTPTLHRVHHSPLPEETDSNFGGLLCVWDRLFGTYRSDKAPAAIPYGLANLAPPRYQSLIGMLRTPVVAWRAPGVL